MKLGRIALVAALAAVAACGTTVPGSHQTLGDSGLQGGGASGTAPGDSSSPAPAPANGGAGAPASPAGTPTASGPIDVGTSPGGSPSLSTSPHAPVEIGIGVDGNNSAFAAAFGVQSSQPDEVKVAAAIVSEINRTGGLAGHPVVPIYSTFDNTSGDWIAQDQASCSKFTEDHHVLAVVRTDDIFGPLDSCLANAGVPLVLFESVFRQPSWFRAAAGNRLMPVNPTADRIFPALFGRMVTTKRWTPATKIGLVRYDRPDQASIETNVIRPALAADSLHLTDAEAVHTPESFQDIGTTSSEIASVILKFRQRGVDNVMFQGGDLSYLFTAVANSQHYTPHYALTTFDFPGLLPTGQLHGAFGIGWQPTDDLVVPVEPPGAKHCQKATISTQPNYTATGADRIYATCDLLFFLQAAYNAAGGISRGALALGAQRLRGGFAASYTFAVDVSSHPDGLAAYRDLLFDEGCSCLRYGGQSNLP